MNIEYVVYHCRKCGYEHLSKKASYSCPRNCPACGEKDCMYSGYKKLPQNSISRDSSPKSYNWCDANDKSIQFYLRALDNKPLGITIDPEYAEDIDETESALEQAKQLLDIANKRFLFFSKKKDLEAMVEHMQSLENESYKNELINREKELRETLVKSFSAWESVKSEIEEITECQQSTQQ